MQFTFRRDQDILPEREEATPDENSEQADREPSRPVDAGDDVLSVPEEDNAQHDTEPVHSTAGGDAPQDASEPEESRL
ncbi:hypothetical protein ACHAP5_011760 [Fusarium lateritium]